MQTIEDDFIADLLMTTTHHYIMFFTNYGRVYRLKTYEIPEGSRTSRGVAIVNILQLNPGEKINAIIPIKDYEENKNLFMVTKNGIVKKTNIVEYSNVRKNGLAAINLRDDDELIEVKITDKNTEIFLVTKYGMCIRFKETDVRATGRTSMGVIGMNLGDGDEIVGMQLDHQGDSLLIVSENGMGKRTYLDEFTVQKRGGKGVKCYKITEKTGYLIGVKAVNDEHEIMIITTGGVIIQIPMEDVSILRRITQKNGLFIAVRIHKWLRSLKFRACDQTFRHHSSFSSLLPARDSSYCKPAKTGKGYAFAARESQMYSFKTL